MWREVAGTAALAETLEALSELADQMLAAAKEAGVTLMPSLNFRFAPNYVKAKELIDRYQHRPGEELFDLRNDPLEMNNLAEDPEQAELLRSLRGRLLRWCKSQGDSLAEEALRE